MVEERGGPIRIGIAEDQEDLRTAFVRLLQRLGHHVVFAAANGEELLIASRAETIDLAVVDFDMPVVDGLTAAEELAERGIPVILVSGHEEAEKIVLEEEPVVARLMKPATLEGLRRAIDQALASRRR